MLNNYSTFPVFINRKNYECKIVNQSTNRPELDNNKLNSSIESDYLKEVFYIRDQQIFFDIYK